MNSIWQKVDTVRGLLTLAACMLAVTPSVYSQSSAEWLMYVGTYTNNPAQPSKGIYAYRFQASGKFTPLGAVAASSNPSFLVVSHSGKFLYAANENSAYEGRPAGSISAFAVDAATGQLKPLNVVSSGGMTPCHVALDQTGKWLFVANYDGGNLAVFPVHADGSLGAASAFVQDKGSSVDPERQRGPYVHSAYVSPDNRFLLAADLGLDHVMIYQFDAAHGTLTAGQQPFATLAPGTGPRHLAFSKDGKFVYVLGELAATVTVFRYNAGDGRLEQTQTISMLPAGYKGVKSGAEIFVHPNGKFLYASNRGHDSIAVFRIDTGSGALTSAGQVSTGGKTPRNFAIDPTGAFLLAANQDSGSVVVFRIDQNTGALTPTGDVLKVPAPVCLVFARTK